MSILTEELLNYNPKVPPILYHYCSIDTFLSIINNCNIWLSDAGKTNDSTETKWVFSEVKKVVEQALDSYKNLYKPEILSKAKNIAYNVIDNLVFGKAPFVRNSKKFLFCFSEAEDLLSQWRSYGDDGKGVAIGFNTSFFPAQYTYELTKVIYDEQMILQFLHNGIDERLNWAIEDAKGKIFNTINDEKLMMICQRKGLKEC